MKPHKLNSSNNFIAGWYLDDASICDALIEFHLLATRPEVVTQVLGIVYRAISGHLIRKAGLTRASALTGAVTLVQRFGSALNANVHFHMLVLDGVYRRDVAQGRLRFVPVPAPSTAELERLVRRIAERIGRSPERAGLITRDIENAYLAFDPSEEAPINALLGHSITYRIATGPREGQKVFTLQTIPADPEAPRRDVAESSGFSLHAGVAAKGSQRDKIEHLARYIARPPIATERLALTENGQVRYALKTPYRDGTTHVIFEPEDFIARLAALVPKPRARGEDPLGQRMSISVGDDVLRTVVGIVGDVVDQKLTDVQEPEIFLPFAQAPYSPYMSVVVRGSGDPLALVPAVRSAVQQVDPNVPARDFRTLERVVGDSVAGERFLSSLLGMFAAAALLLAAIGVFGLFSFTVAERTREIAVRTALGARRVELVTMVLGNALKLTGVGLVVGVAGAAASTRVIEGQLYGVSALDPVTFGAVIVVLTLTAIVACLLPACRAAAVDPMTALRRE